jgi:hypothetical protein
MKIKTEQIVNFINSGIAFAKKYPTGMAYKLHVNHKACMTIYEVYDGQRKELINKYAKKDANGEPIVENDNYIIENIEAWNKDITELLSEEVEVAISEIPAEMLDKCDEIETLSVPEIALIDFMIK